MSPSGDNSSSLHQSHKHTEILSVGSVALDDIQTPKKCVTRVPGGSGFYFAYAASLFQPVRLVSIVGGDYPKDALAELIERGVILDSLVHDPDGLSFRWGCEYDDDLYGRRTILVERNVFDAYTPNLDDTARTAQFIFLASAEPIIQKNIIEQLNSPKCIVIDTIECYIKADPVQLKQNIERSNIFIVNEIEALLLSGEKDVSDAIFSFLRLGVEYVVVKKGPAGVVAAGKDHVVEIPAFPVDADKVVDPTGAGDTFAGGFLGYLALHDAVTWDHIQTACIWGVVVAACAIRDFSYYGLRSLTIRDFNDLLIRYNDLNRI